MYYADGFSDRHAFSTDTNDYATGLNDENEWDENMMDYDIPLDERVDDDLYDDFAGSQYAYNESGYDRERIY